MTRRANAVPNRLLSVQGLNGSGSVEPTQNTRYLDPAFAGTSNGSIAAPYADFAPFLAEIDGSPAAWELRIGPTGAALLEPTVPALDDGALVLRGVTRDWSFLNGVTFEAQSSGTYLELRDLSTGVTFEGGAFYRLSFFDCELASVSDSPAVTEGAAILIDCNAKNFALPAVTLEVHGGAFWGDAVAWLTGRFFGVRFEDPYFDTTTTLTPGAGVSSFVGCEFVDEVTISNANAPTIKMDAYSYASFLAAGGTFAGTIEVVSYGDAGAAQAAADAAQVDATQALADAAAALTAANEADDTADAAQATANTALADAAAALTAANEADDTADAAQATANTAVANAATALAAANEADDTADAAQATANTAVTDAAAAQTTANSALAAAVKFYANWGTVAAPTNPARYLLRTGASAGTTIIQGEYPAPFTGTFNFTITWRVGNPLLVDSVGLTVMKNGVATAVTATIAVSTTSGQATGSLAVVAGDGLCIRVLQAASEAQSAWNLSVSLVATN